MNNATYKTLVAALAGACMGSNAYAACSVSGNAATPFQAGPPNPNNGFSEYVTDSTGLGLELCLGPSQPTVDPVTQTVISPVGAAPHCFFDPPDPANPFSVQIGFGAEGFWWLAAPDTANFPPQPAVADGTGIGAVLVLGAEAAFGGGTAVDGDQFPFTRLRIRVDAPAIGFYRITEPYGEHVYQVSVLGPGNEINDSFDVEFTQGTVDANGNVTEATNDTNCVGPWLTWDTYPIDTGTGAADPTLDLFGPGGVGGPDGIADFIGDGATSHLVTGSPTGNNLFRIEAFTDAGLVTPLNFDPTDADGDGSTNSVTTDLFTVVGRVYDGRLATPMVAERSTYSRDAAGTTGQVDVFTRGAESATVSFTGDPNVGGPFTLLTLLGDFFESALLAPDASVVPSVVEIDATDGATDPTHLVRPLVDLVSITRADYDIGQVPPALTVEANSSDAFGAPTLTLVQLNLPLTAGSVTATEASPGVPLAPPGIVTVRSSAGGSATRLVEVVDSTDSDLDGIPDTADNCPLTANADQADGDGDGVGDVCDNCIEHANASQLDSNGDDYGNRCDADLDDNGLVSSSDVALFRAAFGQTGDNAADFDGNGVVSSSDVAILRALFGRPPGPSALAPPAP
jgi:hypothetical protein